jgi:hypothetical protein
MTLVNRPCKPCCSHRERRTAEGDDGLAGPDAGGPSKRPVALDPASHPTNTVRELGAGP